MTKIGTALRYRFLIIACILAAGVGAFVTLPQLTSFAAPQDDCQANYTIVWGDTLANIAANYGMTFSDIAQANGIDNPDLIYAGQTLCIPNNAQGTSSSAQTSSDDSQTSSAAYYPNLYPWGQCTWWAAQERLDENLEYLGDAWLWAGNAANNGLSIGTTPEVGATVVFQPWVEGAGGLGHVAHVIGVNGDGSFQVSEMNYYANGGGFGIVSYRTAWVEDGVTFIY